MKLEFIRPTDRPTDLGLMILLVLLGIPVAIIASICLLIYFTRHTNKHLVAFFHPYCAAGGGGERVLWTALRDMQLKYPYLKFRIYTGDKESDEKIIEHARERFGVEISLDRLEFCRLGTRFLVEDIYPALTLLMQSLGSMLVALEALLVTRSDLPVTLFGCYVHYPTISTDMIEAVRVGRQSVNNHRPGTRMAQMKLIYYRWFARLYALVGRHSLSVMVNSTWTSQHIQEIWQCKPHCTIVYPPCDVTALCQLPDGLHELGSERDGSFTIVSVAQFRPEKDHRLQLEAFAEFQRRHPHCKAKLQLIGGARNQADHHRIDRLRQYAVDLTIADCVEFLVNVDYEALKLNLSKALIGLHTMWNEHFGIGVVEYLAAGVIPIAHRSGGPLMDIIVPFQGKPVGLLAESKEEYSLAIEQIAFGMSADERQQMRDRGRLSVKQRFSEQEFLTRWHRQTSALIPIVESREQ